MSRNALQDHSNSIVRLNTSKEVSSNVRLNFGGNRKERRKQGTTGGAPKPTYEAYGALQFCYDYFNRSLFDGMLPDVLITFTRKRGALGYFAHSRFENNQEQVSHEISLNPQYTKVLGDRETLSTLVHEMVHLWRHEFGPVNKRGGKGGNGYHDVIWADKMDELGLPPINIGCGKGTRTGYRVTNGIQEGGLFDNACKRLFAEGFRIDWHEVLPNQASCEVGIGSEPDGGSKRKKDKIKFTCSTRACKLNAWAKPSAKLICGICELPMQSELVDGANGQQQMPESGNHLVVSAQCRPQPVGQFRHLTNTSDKFKKGA